MGPGLKRVARENEATAERIGTWTSAKGGSQVDSKDPPLPPPFRILNASCLIDSINVWQVRVQTGGARKG